MDETQNQTQPNEPSVNPDPGQAVPMGQTHPEPQIQSTPTPQKDNSTFGTLIVVGAVVVALAVVAMWYFGGFGSSNSATGIADNQVVATVNGVDIVGSDLATSISQITATAQLQGIDTTDPSVQSEIQNQAIEMLINTEVLEQEATDRGIVITEADVEARLDALVQEIGSEEALEERMVALGIDEETLEADVQSELMIQELLNQVFAEEGVEVTEEEVQELYQATTGGGAEAPALEEIRAQIEAQIRASKEQAIVDGFIAELRSEAEVSTAQ